jgi:hypothetical protein
MPLTSDINTCYKRVLYIADKAGYNGFVSPDDFNSAWQSSEQWVFKQLYKRYPADRDASTSLSVFSTSAPITINGSGQYVPSPSTILYVDSIWSGTNEVTRVEKNRVANNLNSTYDAPSLQFPIYTQYAGYLQFYPVNLGTATFNYLALTNSFWGYTLAGSILTLNTGSLTPGAGYVDGTYNNVPLFGGIGNGATANITVAGGVVIVVVLANTGQGYLVGDNLGTPNTNLGGTGGGFIIPVATISVNARPIYSAANSIQPLWSVLDLDTVVYYTCRKIGINMGDQEVGQFSNQSIGLEQ